MQKSNSPEILNPDQGVQFSCASCIDTLAARGVRIGHGIARRDPSRPVPLFDGKGRTLDNIFIERLWRGLTDEEVYLQAYPSVADARANIGAWLAFTNNARLHQALGY